MLTAFSVYTPVDRATQAFVIDEVDEIPDRFVTWEPPVSTHATGTSSKHKHRSQEAWDVLHDMHGLRGLEGRAW